MNTQKIADLLSQPSPDLRELTRALNGTRDDALRRAALERPMLPDNERAFREAGVRLLVAVRRFLVHPDGDSIEALGTAQLCLGSLISDSREDGSAEQAVYDLLVEAHLEAS